MTSADLWPLSHLHEQRISTHDAPGFIVLGLLLLTAGVSLYFVRKSATARIWFGVAWALLAIWGFPWFIAEGEVVWIIPWLLAAGALSLFFARTSMCARIFTILVIWLLFLAGELQYGIYGRFLGAMASVLEQQRGEADQMEQDADAFDRLRGHFDAAKLDPKRAAELGLRLELLARLGHRGALALRAGAVAWEAGRISPHAYFEIVRNARNAREDQIDRGPDEIRGAFAQSWPASVRDAYLESWDSLSPGNRLDRIEIGNQRSAELRSLLAVLAVNATALRAAPELMVDPKVYLTLETSGRTRAIYDVSKMQAAVAICEAQGGHAKTLYGSGARTSEPVAQTTAVTRWPEIIVLSNELAGVNTELAVLADPRVSEHGTNPGGLSPNPKELERNKEFLRQEELLLEMAISSYAREKAEGIAVAKEQMREEEISALTKELNMVRTTIGESANLQAESTALEEQIARKHAENPRAAFSVLSAALPKSARSIQKAKGALVAGRIGRGTFDEVTQQAKSNLNAFDNFVGEPGFHKFLLEPDIWLTAGGMLSANNSAGVSEPRE